MRKTPACAACHRQRKGCTKECPLAPYFPAERQKDFDSACKLFGVKNITKTLSLVDTNRRNDAVTAMIYAGKVRAKDPVGGCPALIPRLYEHIIQALLDEYRVLSELRYYQYFDIDLDAQVKTEAKMVQTQAQLAHAQAGLASYFLDRLAAWPASV